MSARSARPGALIPTRHRRRLTVLGGVAVLVFAVTACMSADARTFLDRTNDLRASQGVSPLAEHDALTAKAERWAAYLAQTGTLRHSQLTDDLGGLAWQELAENVGVSDPTGDTLLSLQNAFAGSAEHRQNMLNSRYTHLGVGLATGADGRVWVVEVFARL